MTKHAISKCNVMTIRNFTDSFYTAKMNIAASFNSHIHHHHHGQQHRHNIPPISAYNYDQILYYHNLWWYYDIMIIFHLQININPAHSSHFLPTGHWGRRRGLCFSFSIRKLLYPGIMIFQKCSCVLLSFGKLYDERIYF